MIIIVCIMYITNMCVDDLLLLLSERRNTFFCEHVESRSWVSFVFITSPQFALSFSPYFRMYVLRTSTLYYITIISLLYSKKLIFTQ